MAENKENTKEPELVKKRKIKIHTDPHDPKSTHVPVSVNGVTHLIKRGEVVELDEAYIEVLNHAVKESFSQDPETGSLIPHETLTYPFSYMD
jgi:pyruvate kinase